MMMQERFSWIVSYLLIGATAIWPRPWPPQTKKIPNAPQAGNSEFVTRNNQGPFDGVKTSLINATSIEWWYFDACSDDGKQGVAAWMFTTNPLALGQNFTQVDFILFHARFLDGTGVDKFIPSEGLVVQTLGEGSSGFYDGIGSGWTGAPDLSTFSFFFDAEEEGVSGSVHIKSVCATLEIFQALSNFVTG